MVRFRLIKPQKENFFKIEFLRLYILNSRRFYVGGTHEPVNNTSTMATSALVGSGGSAIQRISDTAAMASIPQTTMADGWFGWIGLCTLSV